MNHGDNAERRLALQLAVTRVLMDAETLDQAAARLLREVCEAEGWQAGVLWRLDAAVERMRCHTVWAADAIAPELRRRTRRLEFARGEGRVGQVWATEQPYLTVDVARNEEHLRGRAMGELGLQASWAFPIADGSVVGVIEFYADRTIEPDAQMSELLTSVGRQIGLLVERVEARAERRRAQAALQSSERLASLGNLAAGVAHEINNPLTYVRLNLARLLSMEAAREKDEERMHRIEMLQECREGIDRAARILRDLKVLARRDNRELESIELWEPLEVALKVASHEVRHRAKLVRVHGDAPAVWADESKLAQVFVALLVNAAQAIPEGEVGENSIRVETSTDAQGRAVVTIADTGCGMSSETARRVFEPFFSASPHAGTGLGLWICKELVDQLDGHLEVDSRPGHGTVCRVVLPASDRPPREQEVTPSAGIAAAQARPARALIVDDDRTVAAAVAASLGSGYEVVVAGSGREALEILRHEDDFDAIICDLIMGDITGMDVYEALCLVAPHLAQRMVFMTAGAFTASASRFLDTVSNLRVDKPFSIEALRELINRQLARNAEHKRVRVRRLSEDGVPRVAVFPATGPVHDGK